MVEDILHRAGSDECMVSIAARYGFYWRTLWNLPQNAALKAKRTNPNVLKEGDEVFVPARRIKEEIRPTDARHHFRLVASPSKFRMRLLSSGEPRASLPYTCLVDGHLLSGQTDSDGVLSLSIPPGAKTGFLRLRDGGTFEEYDLDFGSLDPLKEISGIQQRLNNLGYDCEVTGELDDQTRDAILSFGAKHHLSDFELLGEEFRNLLASAHGA